MPLSSYTLSVKPAAKLSLLRKGTTMMKNLTRFALALGLLAYPALATAVNKPYPYDLRTQDPESVLNAVFYAARTGDLAILSVLCDPKGENDNDTKGICALGTPAGDRKIKPLFLKAFAGGKTIGKPEFGRVNDIVLVDIPFEFTSPKDSQLVQEKMTLVQRYGNWYLSSF